MNRYLTFSLAISVTLNTLAIPSRAANRRTRERTARIRWFGPRRSRKAPQSRPISIVGQIDEEKSITSLPVQYARTQDPEWYAEQQQGCGTSWNTGRLSFENTGRALDDARRSQAINRRHRSSWR